MSLDLSKTLEQVEGLASRLRYSQDERSQRLNEALGAMRTASPDDVRQKLNDAQGRTFLWARVIDGLAERYCAAPAPEDFGVVSTDGSHIDVDRHVPVACALINLGTCVLRYGARPEAYLSNYPRIYSDDELYLTNHGPSVTEVPIEGAILGLKRTVEEVKALEPLVREVPQDLPTLALLDGSLILWSLSGRGYPPLVQDEIIQKGLLPALDSLQQMARHRTLALAAYVSLPRSTEVVNCLRLYLCATDALECGRKCSNRRSPVAPCDKANDLLDRELFRGLLEPGQRSSLFYTNSSVVRDYYGKHRVFFYYLHTGEEIARVEMPEWVALDEELLSLSHTLILDQCRRGMGYPVALSEAHEQAVISGPDRQRFRDLVEVALTKQGLPVYTSEKSRSKRLAWL